MIILTSIADLDLLVGPIVLAAGTFDGLHLGHQALIARAMEEASRVNGTAVVLSFDRHPASITRPEMAPKLLTRNKTKLAILEQMGIPVVLLLEFNAALASISAEAFIRSFPTSLHEICVGSQWSFGHRGAGNITLLKQLGGELGFTVASILPVEIHGKPISSTRIRAAIALGDFKEASACLGRNFRLIGKVVTGAGLGATIGFPTANLDVEEMQVPPDGVYAVRVSQGLVNCNGVVNIGVRPTVDSLATKRIVEVHLLDYSENLVGEELALEFIQFLRGEVKFPNLDALKAQIFKDCEQAKAILTLEKLHDLRHNA